MCGIAGIISRDTGLLAKIRKMTEVQSHRGPDGVGHLLIGATARLTAEKVAETQPGDFLALGHRRLAILDCTSAGAQPMSSPDGKYWISYNGEVYNYLELRGELEAAGYRFSSGSDTEVVLAAYRAWGVRCFERFNGMWAMAIWDAQRQCLVLSRDRLGVKPLYLLKTNKALLFASEIKGILATNLIEPRLNISVAIDYLKWSMVGHRLESFFQGITAFPPGHYAVVEKNTVKLSPAVPFWCLTPSSSSLGMEDAAREFAEHFKESVRLRLRSDVPVGSCLSGGLDSSAIVCEMNRQHDAGATALHTFNAASHDPRFDERRWADLVNTRVQAQAHYTFPAPDGFEQELDQLLWHQEEPFTSASIYAQWQIMKAARGQGVPVLLDGQGADECLCGYRKFYMFYLRQLIQERRIGRFIKEVSALLVQGDRGLLRWREGARYLPFFLRTRIAGIRELLQPGLRKTWDSCQINLGEVGSIAERQIADIQKYSVPSLLRYEDRNSMAWSIESRVPFLDYRLVEWTVAAPTGVKLAGGRTKAVLRKALRGLVPDEILDRRDKMGFVTAQEVWMKKELQPAIEQCFSDESFPLASFFDQKVLLAEYRNWLVNGKGTVSQQELFRVFILARWVKRFNVNCTPDPAEPPLHED